MNQRNRRLTTSFLGKYHFPIPKKVCLRLFTNDRDKWIDTSTLLWAHPDAGKFHWNKLRVPRIIKSALMRYTLHLLQSAAPRTSLSVFERFLRNQKLFRSRRYPLTTNSLLSILTAIPNNRDFTTIRTFFKWATQKQLPGFEAHVLKEAMRVRLPEKKRQIDPRSRKRFLTDAQEHHLYKILEILPSVDDPQLRNNVLTHLTWELGIRPIQSELLQEKHIHHLGTGEGTYSSLDVVRVKQGHIKRSYKSRQISDLLYSKLLTLIAQNRIRFGPSSDEAPLIRTNAQGNRRTIKTKLHGQRLAAGGGPVGIRRFLLEHTNLPRGISANSLRHNMAQRLADAGAAAAVIAEMLDHSNLTSVKVYTEARSNLAEIKTRALGMSKTYSQIIEGLMGKRPIMSSGVEHSSQRIQGMIAGQYIGNIGACDLPLETKCPLNPVYACYGCKDFTPFIDGEHEAVVNAMASENLHLVENLGEDGKRLALQNEFPLMAARAISALCNKAGEIS